MVIQIKQSRDRYSRPDKSYHTYHTCILPYIPYIPYHTLHICYILYNLYHTYPTPVLVMDGTMSMDGTSRTVPSMDMNFVMSRTFVHGHIYIYPEYYILYPIFEMQYLHEFLTNPSINWYIDRV